MRNKYFIYLCLIVLLGITSCGHRKDKSDNSILVYSAAGITDVITELRDSFQVKYKTQVHLNLASSGTLARQIEQGAEPDVYISASLRWANYIADLGFVVDSMMEEICTNAIVLIAPSDSRITPFVLDSTSDLIALLEEGYFSIGNPAHVPVGKYAQESLEYYQQYESLTPHLLMSKDTRSALMMVEMGEAALGIVYYTDALRTAKVKIVAMLPDESHSTIKYVASLCKEEVFARTFMDYIESEEVQWMWKKHGFNR